MTGVEIAIWCAHAISIGLFILALGLLVLLAKEMLDHARINRMRESKGPIIGWPREHSNFRSLPVPKIGDVLKFSRIGMEYGYAVVADAREPIPPFKIIGNARSRANGNVTCSSFSALQRSGQIRQVRDGTESSCVLEMKSASVP